MRARNIKPGFYKNADLAECSMAARFLAPGLWMLADKEGRLQDRPKQIKGEIFPYDDIDVDQLLGELAHAEHLIRYEVGGKRFIQITKFIEHQRPHSNELPSNIPPIQPLNKNKEELPTKVERASSLTTDSLIPDSLLPITSAVAEDLPSKKISKGSEESERFWRQWPKDRRCEKPKFLKEFQIAIKKTTPECLLDSLSRYLKTPEVLGGFAPYPAKWLKQERWIEAMEEDTGKKQITDEKKAEIFAWKRRRGLSLASDELRFLEDYQKQSDNHTNMLEIVP